MANVNSALNQLNDSVQNFQSKVEVHVNNVDTTTQKIHSVAQNIYDKVNQFRTDIMHGEEQQLAQENIMRIDQIIKEQFGNYDAIRKTIMGVVRDFDINRATIEWRGENALSLQAHATAYYMDPSTVIESTKTITPGGK